MTTRFVMQARLGKSGRPHCELVELPADELPDGVGFTTRADCKRFHKRPVNAPPIWIEEDHGDST